MKVEIQANNSSSPGARYVTWVPSPCRVRVTNPTGMVGNQVPVRLAGRTKASGGSIELAAQAGGPYASSLTVTLLRNGTSVPFFVRGVFGKPSSADRDVAIEARARALREALRLLAGDGDAEALAEDKKLHKRVGELQTQAPAKVKQLAKQFVQKYGR